MDNYASYADALLVKLLNEGSTAAFTEIYNRYWLTMCDAAYKRLGEKELAEDVVQNIFIKLWNGRQSLQIENLPAYLMVSVRNGVISMAASEKKAVPAFSGPFEEVLMEKDTPDSRLAVKELMALVMAYADTLPEKRKQIFLLHIKERLSTREIAERLDVSQKTVQNQLRTALRGLESHLPIVLLAILLKQL